MAKQKKQKNPIVEEIERHNKVLMEHMDKQVKVTAEQYDSINRKLEEHDQRFDSLEVTIMENRIRIDRV
jgi:hypothetical protein